MRAFQPRAKKMKNVLKILLKKKKKIKIQRITYQEKEMIHPQIRKNQKKKEKTREK